jgi:hypothetical protein
LRVQLSDRRASAGPAVGDGLLQHEETRVHANELVKLQTYLRKVFGAKTLSVRARPKVKDSAEVFIGDEFIATITVDEEDGERAYQLQMAILEMDLDEA